MTDMVCDCFEYILIVIRCSSMLGQPYQIAVYKVFSRRVVSACHFAIVFVGCFIFAATANWLYHAITVNFDAATQRDVWSQRPGELNEALLNYGVVIDCGSSGSRVFVYCWPPHSGQPHQLLNIRLFHDSNGNPAIMKTEPGKHFMCWSIHHNRASPLSF